MDGDVSMDGIESTDFQQRSDAFLHWLKSRPGTKINPNIELVDLRQRGAGRGVVAKADIEEDEELFSVARSDILSVDNSGFTKHSAAREYVAGLEDPWMSLILVLIYEHLRGSASPWKPYFDILPSSFDTLMFWTEDELAELQASAVRQKIGKAGADEAFEERVWGFVQSHSDLFPGLRKEEVMALAHRMGSTIMAYAFDIEKEPSKQEQDEEGYISDEEDEMLPKGMVPLADMLNADADRNNARLEYGENEVTMKALKPIKAGEEIFNDYGPLPRADLLRRYGYITQNYEQYDVVEVALDDFTTIAEQMGQKKVDEKCAYLEKIEVLEDAYDITRGEDGDLATMIPEEMAVLVNTLVLDDSAFAELKKNKKSRPSVQLDRASVPLLENVLEQRLSQYASTLQEDDILIKEFYNLAAYPNQATKRKRMAIHVRHGEKEILTGTLNKLRAISGAGSEDKGKRKHEEENGQSSKKSRVR
ncbi:Ribosomal lysine N-methyltransferase 4 [Taxawa tesnikishii (nom. ined.)]|nr:Ribosomal lysine N-methyltransferase 4 [Dothideales sp. JES 119]